jgi:hypothetical protein
MVSHKKPAPEEPPMYTLYYSPGSASLAPHGVLEESGAPDTLVPVDMAA